MESGEKEMRLAFEDVTTRNVKGMIAYSKDTRKLARETEKKVQDLDGVIRTYEARFAEMTRQLSLIQAQLYRGGTV